MNLYLKTLISEITKHYQTFSRTQLVHAAVVKSQLTLDPFYATKITRFYALNNDLISARKLFDENPKRSIYLWNSIIRAYAKAHKFSDAFLLLKQLMASEIPPDNYTFACVSRACLERFDLLGLRCVHGKSIVFGFGLDYICNSSLVSCYSKLSRLVEASSVFLRVAKPDVVLWNTIISGYGSCGDYTKAAKLFIQMMNFGERPDGYTIVGLLIGVSDPSLLQLGNAIHGFCVKCSLIMNGHVGSALVSLYSRCMDMDLACRVFDNLVQPDLITWSALITGFSESGDDVSALIIFRKLLEGGGRSDHLLLSSVLAASARLAIAKPGCEIHCYAVRQGYDGDVMLSSALVDMYAKCGFLELGIRVFRKMPKKNVTSYNSIISALGLYGRAGEAFLVFEDLLENGLKPDETTFSGLLSACCHAGLVKEGQEFFKRMSDDFGIVAKAEHHIYMIKILGMDAQLKEAYEFITSLPHPVSCDLWGALLSCCAAHKNYVLAEVIAERIAETEMRRNSGYDVMFSNLLADDGRWNDVMHFRVERGGARGKMPGKSWIGV